MKTTRCNQKLIITLGEGYDGSLKHQPEIGRSCQKDEVFGKETTPVFVFILSFLSILRLLKIVVTTTSHYSSRAATLSLPVQQECSSPSECSKERSNAPPVESGPPGTTTNATLLTPKEFTFSNLISKRAPCNLLVFGLQLQYFNLSSINAGGVTLFLEDDPYKIRQYKEDSNGTRIYKVQYQKPAKNAYKMLKHSKENPICAPRTSLLQQSTCKLALRNLPQVYQLKWDVVLVDGPSGEAPGRMTTIYTASVLARAGKTTDVVVHIHSTIEKWFSWEFLCEENLVSAKGKFWNFRISDQSNSTKFCTSEKVQIE
ncbi:1-deoxy-D-xylulose 5-phosphate reductoisomerase [Hibiscus syriacus]|uniref:1-deoxy-D-xylulose 5-phosphate reductoisomerase n=1 Tax=Hibiscus syriacus TaxID=106335 RepID=A0A6A2YE48_HIBSY|nr:1-deoxy-D-xylulose 5-phosphate reductoisomerase [Hibiscus syriacus]